MELDEQLDAIALVAKKRDKVTKWLEKIADKNRPRIKADLTVEKDRLDRIIKAKIESLDKEYRGVLNEYFQVIELPKRRIIDHGKPLIKHKRDNSDIFYRTEKPCKECGGFDHYIRGKACVFCTKEKSKKYAQIRKERQKQAA
ncbi:hypothetical protein CH513_15475 [Salmonella enterica subsp. enterica serovar Infantis]|nr:hypothetical protein [Salmonella enterica subsp. enterica serovar Infantis]